MSSQENLDNTIFPEENFTEHPDMPKTLPRLPPITMADPYAEISNLELHIALLALAQQATPHSQKKHRGIREPDTFSGNSIDDLWAFIFQCQIYFRACEREFKEDSEKVYFAISYLRETYSCH